MPVESLQRGSEPNVFKVLDAALPNNALERTAGCRGGSGAMVVAMALRFLPTAAQRER